VQILDKDGNRKGDVELSDDSLKEMYWFMVLARTANTKILNLQKQGRIGTYASIHGQEAIQAAVGEAIKENDNIWIAQSFREMCTVLSRGYPLHKIMQYWGGFEYGMEDSAKYKVLPINIPIASQLNHTTGVAMAMQIKGEKGAAIGFVGDGGTSSGEFNEALNFAGAFKVPAVFIIQNNQYAISVPRKKQSAAKTLAQKAAAYGFDGIQVDGNDVLGSYKVVKEALKKAMEGGGPTLIEAVTYRVDNHTTADDWKKYRTEDEVKEWGAKDPMKRLQAYLRQKGVWDDSKEKELLEKAKQQVEEATKKYESTTKPNVDEIFDFLYAKLPYHIAQQKEEWKTFWGGQDG